MFFASAYIIVCVFGKTQFIGNINRVRERLSSKGFLISELFPWIEKLINVVDLKNDNGKFSTKIL